MVIGNLVTSSILGLVGDFISYYVGCKLVMCITYSPNEVQPLIIEDHEDQQ